MSADYLDPASTGPTTGGASSSTPPIPSSPSSPATPAKEQAQQAASTAADEGKHVAGVAGQEAQKVASEAKAQVTNLVGEATSQVEDQSRTQRDRLVKTLRGFSDDLDEMASQKGGGMAADLAREASTRARTLTSQLDGREPRELLDDVRSFARRRPGAFLLGAAAAGVVAGRLTRGAKDAKDVKDVNATTDHRPEFAAPVEPTLTGTGTAVPAPGSTYPVSPAVTTEPSTTGLPNPGGSVAGDTTWSETRTAGGLS